MYDSVGEVQVSLLDKEKKETRRLKRNFQPACFAEENFQ